MTEPDGRAPFDNVPEAEARSPRRLSPSLVWLVPLVAAVIGGWLAVHALMARGPTITIQFSSAEGIEPGKTRIKYKDVDIGEVTAVTLSPDRHHILVTADMVKQAEPYLVGDSRFWVVRPRIMGGTVSGLDTLLSGAYIGMDVGKSAAQRKDFVGLDEAPVVSGDHPGRQLTLMADDLGSLQIGSPLFFRRVPVGQVIGYRLTPDGRHVAVSVFINRPYDAFVKSTSRFWHASGLDFTVDANGLKVDSQSMVSMALGGIAFETPDAGATGEPAAATAENTFMLARDHDQAMQQPDPDMLTFLVRFHESVRGLSVGAPVEFRGIPIGEVMSIGLDGAPSNGNVGILVTIHLSPSKLLAKMPGQPSISALQRLTLKQSVSRGLRAQLRSGNMLTGQLYVGLDYFPDAPPAAISRQNGVVVLPSVTGDLTELQQSLGHIAKSIERMQLDRLSADMRRSLHSLDRTLSSTGAVMDGVNRKTLPQLQSTLSSMQHTLDAAQQTLRPDAPLQQELRDAARQVSAAARSVQNLSDTLEQHPEALIRGKPGDQR